MNPLGHNNDYRPQLHHGERVLTVADVKRACGHPNDGADSIGAKVMKAIGRLLNRSKAGK